jgi:Holliday junction resolvase RusA-like endonuclease
MADARRQKLLAEAQAARRTAENLTAMARYARRDTEEARLEAARLVTMAAHNRKFAERLELEARSVEPEKRKPGKPITIEITREEWVATRSALDNRGKKPRAEVVRHLKFAKDDPRKQRKLLELYRNVEEDRVKKEKQ